MSKYRIALLGVLAVVVLASAYYWLSVAKHSASAPVRSALQVEVTLDGAIDVDGERFTDPEKLRMLLAVLRRQRPVTEITAYTPKEISPESLGKAAKLLHDSGENEFSFESGANRTP